MPNRQPPKGGNDWRNFLDDDDDDSYQYDGDFAVGGGPSRTGRHAPTATTSRGGGRGRGGAATSSASTSATATAATQVRGRAGGVGYRAPLTTTIISRGRGRPATTRQQTGHMDVPTTTHPQRVASGRYVPTAAVVEEIPSSSLDDDDDELPYDEEEDEDDEEVSNSSSNANQYHPNNRSYQQQRTSSTRGGGMGAAAASSSSQAYDHFAPSFARHQHHHEQPECQILLATGGCEYGLDCHYSHDVRTLQRQFPDAPLFNDPVVITAYHENRTALSSYAGGGGGVGSSNNSNSSATSSSHRRPSSSRQAATLTNGGSTNSRQNSSSSASYRPVGGGFQPPRPATTNVPPSSSSASSTRGGGARGGRMLVGTDDNDTGIVRRGTGRPRGGGYLDSRVVEMSPGVFQIHRGSNDDGESDFDIFTRVIGGNPHRNRGGFGGGGPMSSSAARTANPWMAPRTTSTTTGSRGGARGGRGGRGGGGHQTHHFDPFGGAGGDRFEGGMDVDNMTYEELLQLQEDHGGDVPTPLPSNVLQTFPPVRYGTPAYHREVKAVLSSMRALNPTADKTKRTTTTTTTTTSSSRPSVSGARPSTAIEIYDAEDDDDEDGDGVVALTPPEARVSATEEAPDATPEIQDCLICCYSISQNPNDDEEPQPASSSSASTTSARAPLVRVLLCGHEFHSDCILEWFAQKRTCPICKQDLSALYNQMFNISGRGSTSSSSAGYQQRY